MLKKITLISISVITIQAATMSQLLDGVKNSFAAKSDKISVYQSKNALDIVKAQYWPKINFVASYTHYSQPYSMRPISPTESAKLSAAHKPMPISKNITSFQLALSMPIFVKSLYTLADKAMVLKESAQLKRRLNILKNQAAVIGANANWIYLESLKRSLYQKRKTLLTTLKITKAQVRLGSQAKLAIYKVKEGLNKVNISISDIKIQEENLKSLIRTLSQINVKKPVRMRKIGSYHVASFIQIAPLKAKNRANLLEMKAQKEKLYYPSVNLAAQYTKSYGKDYLQNKSVNTNFSSVGIKLNMPLLDMPQRQNIQKAKLAYMKGAIDIKKLELELKNRAKQMREQLKYLKESKRYARENIANEKKLLNIAKVSYELGKMPIEEYLRYIDALYAAKADYYKIEASYWQTLAQLAFVYGNNFKRIVR